MTYSIVLISFYREWQDFGAILFFLGFQQSLWHMGERQASG